MTACDGPDVLRGMDIEAEPIRLRRAGIGFPTELPAENGVEELAGRRGYEEGLREGHVDGLRRGYEEGSRKAREELAARVEAAAERAAREAAQPLRDQQEKLVTLVAAIAAQERTRHEHAEDEMVALCYEALCSVLGSRAVRPATVRAHLAHLASTQGSGQEGLALHVHPQDAALLKALGSAANGDHATAVRWVADPQVRIGGCIAVRSGAGLDLRLETALERCKEVLLEARRRRRTPGKRHEHA